MVEPVFNTVKFQANFEELVIRDKKLKSFIRNTLRHYSM